MKTTMFLPFRNNYGANIIMPQPVVRIIQAGSMVSSDYIVLFHIMFQKRHLIFHCALAPSRVDVR